MNIDIANRLYELRKKSSFSQEELAEKIGVRPFQSGRGRRLLLTQTT